MTRTTAAAAAALHPCTHAHTLSNTHAHLQERKDFKDYDPRFIAALDLIKSGAFGRPDYFDDLVASISDMNRGNDWFLLGEPAAVLPLNGCTE